MAPRLHRGLLSGAAAAFALALMAPAQASALPISLTSSQSALSGVTLSLPERETPEVLDKVLLKGRIAFPGAGEYVTVEVRREGRPVLERHVKAHPVSGRFRLRVKLKGCCSYVVQAAHRSETSYPLAFEVRPPRTLDAGRHALLFHQLLRRAGYHLDHEEINREVNEGTGLAVMAMRKVNDQPRTEEYEPWMFRLLMQGRGAFEPEHDEPGRHVEVDVSRQVMALVEDGEPVSVFHVSTGAGGTPYGEWSFYDKGPGYNAKGMYYSVYYDGNYATHGYSSVPTYPASHGCTRNPIPYAVYIYDWIELGDTMYVYA